MKIETRLQGLLWPEGISSRIDVYALLDGAQDDRVHGFLQASYLDKLCLYAGDLPSELVITAPWLVRLEQGNSWTNRILSHGWTNNWGVFLRTEIGSGELRKHFRRFLRVSDESGRTLIFRYYDPRVLRVYLPTCTPSELATFFGPVQQFLVEGTDGMELIEFATHEGELRQTAMLLQPS